MSQQNKRTEHVAPNNDAVCCVDLLLSFDRGFGLYTEKEKASEIRLTSCPLSSLEQKNIPEKSNAAKTCEAITVVSGYK